MKPSFRAYERSIESKTIMSGTPLMTNASQCDESSLTERSYEEHQQRYTITKNTVSLRSTAQLNTLLLF